MHAPMPLAVVGVVGKDLWTGIPIVEKVIRTVAVYLGLVLLLRLGGKRDLAQLNSFDLVVLLLLSNVVQNAVIGNDTSLSGGLLGAAVLIAANAVVERTISATPKGYRLFEGNPTVVVRNGQPLQAMLRRIGLRRADLESAVRRQGAARMDDVEEAVLGPGGAIVVNLKEEAQGLDKADLHALEARIDARIDAVLEAIRGRP